MQQQLIDLILCSAVFFEGSQHLPNVSLYEDTATSIKGRQLNASKHQSEQLKQQASGFPLLQQQQQQEQDVA